MPRFECTNEDCSYSVTFSKIKYVTHCGRMVPDVNIICPDCGCGMEKVVTDTVSFEDIQVSQNRFASLSEKEQKEVLKKRSRDHFNKHDKAIVEQKRNDTIKSIKEQFTKNVKR